MILPTKEDELWANKYVFEREKLLNFNWYLKKYPHLFSYVSLEIHANVEAMHAHRAFADHLILVRMKGSKEFCEKMRCNKYYPRGKECKMDDKLKIFKSGNSTITACEKGCFNIFTGPQKMSALTQWSQRCEACLQHNETLYAGAIDDFRRTENHTTPHQDTVGTGYDVDVNNNFVSDTGDEALQYKLNSFYCDDFQKQFFDTYCAASAGEAVAGFFLGDNIIDIFKFFFTKTIFGESLGTVNTPDLKPVTETDRIRLNKQDTNWWTINENAFCINPNITLSNLGINNDNIHMFYSTEFGWPGHLVEPLLLYQTINTNVDDNPTSPLLPKTSNFMKWLNEKQINFTARDSKIPYHLQINADGKRKLSEYDVLNIRHQGVSNGNINAEMEQQYINWYKYFEKYLLLAGGFVSDLIIQEVVRKLLAFTMKTVLPTIVKFAETTALKLTNYLIRSALEKIIAQQTIKYGAAFLTKLFAKIGVFASSGYAAIILFILMIVDFSLGLADPLRMADMLDQSGIDVKSKLEIEFNKHLYGFGTWEFSPIYFIYLMKHDESSTVNREQQLTTWNTSMKNVQFLTNYRPQQNTHQQTYNLSQPHPLIGYPVEYVGNPDEDIFISIYFKADYFKHLKINSEGMVIDVNPPRDINAKHLLDMNMAYLTTKQKQSFDLQRFCKELQSTVIKDAKKSIIPIGIFAAVVPWIIIGFKKYDITIAFLLLTIFAYIICVHYSMKLYTPSIPTKLAPIKRISEKLKEMRV